MEPQLSTGTKQVASLNETHQDSSNEWQWLSLRRCRMLAVHTPTLTYSLQWELDFSHSHGYRDGDQASPALSAARCGHTSTFWPTGWEKKCYIRLPGWGVNGAPTTSHSYWIGWKRRDGGKQNSIWGHEMKPTVETEREQERNCWNSGTVEPLYLPRPTSTSTVKWEKNKLLCCLSHLLWFLSQQSNIHLDQHSYMLMAIFSGLQKLLPWGTVSPILYICPVFQENMKM